MMDHEDRNNLQHPIHFRRVRFFKIFAVILIPVLLLARTYILDTRFTQSGKNLVHMPYRPDDSASDGNQTCTGEYNKDGSVSITEERINHDGSISITTTTKAADSQCVQLMQ